MPELSNSILELRGVTKWYESAPERRILDGLDLVVVRASASPSSVPSGAEKAPC